VSTGNVQDVESVVHGAKPWHADEMSTVAERIRMARERRGLGVNKLAAAAGLSQGTVSRIERGGRSTGARAPGVGEVTLKKIAAALNVRPEWLMTGEGPFEAEADPLPHRSEAIKIAREGGVPEPVLEAVAAAQVPEAESRSTWWWVQAIQRREVYFREEGALPPSSKAPLTMLSPTAGAVSSHHRPVVKRSS
jgi:transcriptional regulator with XRE-family HTH domain